MNETRVGTTRAQIRQLTLFLRHLLKGPCHMEECGTGLLRLVGSGERQVERAIVRQALSRGLAQLIDGRLVASPAAAAFLKRALLGAEDGFAGQHRDLVAGIAEVEGERQSVTRNAGESPLGAVARLKERSGSPFLPPEALAAGERLLADFTHGQMQPKITASWEPRLAARGKGERGGQADLADSAMAARQRFANAMQAMGPELCGVAADVCCFGKGLEAVERERGWPARSAKLMLRTALMALSRHYCPPAPPPRRRNHHWGAADYRPVIS